MTPQSNCTPTTATSIFGTSWCTSLCVHHTQPCSAEGTLVSKSPLTTRYESSLATPTCQKRSRNHQPSSICFLMRLIKPHIEGTLFDPMQLSGISIHQIPNCSVRILSKSSSLTLAYATGWWFQH